MPAIAAIRAVIIQVRPETIRDMSFSIHIFVTKYETIKEKFETRNPKQYRMFKIQMFQTLERYACDSVLDFGHSIFEFVSYFDIRISNLCYFGFRVFMSQ
ncbi:MAG: hypothetical protein A2Z25_22345 [Planctomycetes bacterium RBG_16_55_9]|nr:MAG: hypothetical protein A2Z25_22345 [Planctomycetes bacterium RBG_16_55_9]